MLLLRKKIGDSQMNNQETVTVSTAITKHDLATTFEHGRETRRTNLTVMKKRR